jgi:phosphate-selective porin OprO/OprP
MHGRTTYLAIGLTAIACLLPAGARGQDYLASDSTAVVVPSPGMPSDAIAGQFVSATEVAPGDATARMAAMEKVIQELVADKKKAEEKAAADKKKAAGQPTYKLRGRTYVDWASFDQDATNRAVYGNARDGVGFRTARLGLEDEMFNVFSYCTEIDFVASITNPESSAIIGDGIAFKEVWMGVSELPLLQNARVGHFKEPFSLEELTSSRFITFMERSMINQAVVPAYNLGGMVFGANESKSLLWQTGVFQNDLADNFVSRTSDNLATAWTSRLVWLPWYYECTDGRGLLHFAGSYSYRDAYGNAHNFRAQPSARFGAPYIVSAGNPTLADYQLAGAEAAWVRGPFSVQSEFINASLDNPAAGRDQNIWGFYVMASYFLTGENRGYKRDVGRFDRVKPFENFFRVSAEDNCIYTGKGAWELAYRYDYIDMTNVSASAGLASNHTLGVNWYLSPYNRIMWDYVHCEPQKNGADAGSLDAAMMRFQVDF